MDLRNARFGHAKNLRDFPQTHILKIIESENFPLRLRQLIQASRNQGR